MAKQGDLLSIGELAKVTGLPVRTIRFWSDQGVIPLPSRTACGHRLYGSDAVSTLRLVRALRDLGFDLKCVQQVVRGQTGIDTVAGEQIANIESEIRSLRLRASILRWMTGHERPAGDLPAVCRRAQLSPAERQELIDDFVDEVFADIEVNGRGAALDCAMRKLPARLPAEPTAAQTDAWVELADLICDRAWVRRLRRIVRAATVAGGDADMAEIQRRAAEHVPRAIEAGVQPGCPAADEVVDQVLGPDASPGRRKALADRLQELIDPRLERYWELLAVLNDREPAPPYTPRVEWLVAALRHYGDRFDRQGSAGEPT